MHASHLKKKYFNLTLNSFFEFSKSAILKKENFFRKIFRFVLNENTDQFCDQKNSNMYLMKIQFSFETRKNLDLYLMKIQISFETKKNSDLYLMKIQISFETRKNSDLYLMKIQISFETRKIHIYI